MEEVTELSQSAPGLRKGKWTAEEEEYTRRLVQYFNQGLLLVPDGTTLRAFLSSRLQCDRMRVTKKFRGVRGASATRLTLCGILVVKIK
jgi:hypothetical protein